MANIRYSTDVPSFQKETAFAVKEGSFSSQRRFIAWEGWDKSQFSRGVIENSNVKADLGGNEPGVGLANDNSTLNFSVYAEGVGAPATDGETPVPNAFTRLLEASLGNDAVIMDGSTIKAATSPDESVIAETDAAAHAANGVCVLEDTRVGNAGLVVCRPYNSYVTDTMTMLMDFPASLAATMAPGDTIYGCIVVNLDETGVVSLQGDILGAVAEQSYEFFGAVFNFSIGEVANGEAPKVAFEGKLANFTRNIATARTSVDSQRPTTLAGGEFLLAQFGNTAATVLSNLRFNFVLGREYKRQSEQNDQGIGGWFLAAQNTELTLYVNHDDAPPAGFSASDYYELHEDRGVTARFHYFCSLGNRYPGRIFGFYLPKLHMSKPPEPANTDDAHLVKLTFMLTQGGNAIRAFQA